MRRVAILVPLVAAAVAVPAQAPGNGPMLRGLRVTNGSTPFFGDGRLLGTVSPNGDGFRDAAHLYFRLTAPARVSVQVIRTDTANSDPEIASTNVIARIAARRFSKGAGEIVWTANGATPPRTYVPPLGVNGRTYNAGSPPVVRVQGIDAGFLEPSYAPGQEAAVTVSTDAKTLTFQVFAYGGGAFPSVRDLRTSGQAMTTAARVDWSAHRDAPAPIRVVRPGEWPSGLYFLRVTAADGRVGYAPFIVKPRTLGSHRIAVVLATQTWQAYNFTDANGDGWGDSWYVSGGRTRAVDLTRPFLDFGLPFRFHDWDLTFLTWLQQTGKQVDF